MQLIIKISSNSNDQNFVHILTLKELNRDLNQTISYDIEQNSNLWEFVSKLLIENFTFSSFSPFSKIVALLEH
jgi:hypothetical protein